MKKTTIALSLVLAGGVLYGCTPTNSGDEYKPRVTSTQKQEVMSSLTAYSESAIPENAPYILFFYADWCPTCVAWEKSVNGTELPGNAVILKVDYDTEEALKEQYGITKQSTAVMIGADGEVVATASDPSMEDVATFFETYEGEESESEEVVADASEDAEVQEGAMGLGYVDYSEAVVPADQAYILFFHADWCPTCVAWEQSVSEADLPANTTILKVDYDTAEALKDQYGITKQSTAVMIGADGEVVATASDPSMEDVTMFFDGYAEAEEELVEELDEVAEELTEDAEEAVAEVAVATGLGYVDYSEAVVPTDQAYVLFFYADWCPTCVAWEKSVAAADLPANTTILKVNYDEAEALKDQYGITKQSTAVMIGADGEVVATASDPSMEDVAAFFEGA